MKSFRQIRQSAVRTVLKHYRLTVVVSSLAVLAFGYVFVLNDQIRSVRDVGFTSSNEKRQEVDDRERTLRQLRAARDAFRQLSAGELDQLVRVLPLEADLPGLFAQVQSLANEGHVTLSSIDSTKQGALTATTSSGKTVNIERLSIAIQVTGFKSYGQFKQFLGLLEGNMRLLDLSALNYDPHTTSYALNLSTYYLGSL